MNKESDDRKGRKSQWVKIPGNWQDAVKRALKKKRPKEGWPDQEKPEKGSK